ncbi:MAG TPA: haloacid dehalogenase type II, partial [Acidimicrobiales bacterium]|nr:haloacid dehalogenase type II [Acidimicrobiales bacterium]
MHIAFDVFGTLADTSSVRDELSAWCGESAGAVATEWRARQLEYMFRATAMGRFPPFGDLTRWALEAALAGAGIAPRATDELERMTAAYRRLAPFDDVVPALGRLRARGHHLVAFSVGPRAWLDDLTAGYHGLVERTVSAEDAGVYKPHPGIYRHLLAALGAAPGEVLLVSSNPFDLIGGAAVGLRTAWCRRDAQARFDPWGPRPDHVVDGLEALCDLDLDAATPPGGAGGPGVPDDDAGPQPDAYGDRTAGAYDELYAGAFDTDGAVE